MISSSSFVETTPAEIEKILAHVYINLDFYAAPYLGYIEFDREAPHFQRSVDVNIGEQFQKWCKSLKGTDANNMRRLSRDLCSALEGCQEKWKELLVGNSLFDSPCLYSEKDNLSHLISLLQKEPNLVLFFRKHMTNYIISKWYSLQATINMLQHSLKRTAQLAPHPEHKYLCIMPVTISSNNFFKSKDEENKVVPVRFTKPEKGSLQALLKHHDALFKNKQIVLANQDLPVDMPMSAIWVKD